jgi:predicted RNase H-like HicB family nuclease
MGGCWGRDRPPMPVSGSATRQQSCWARCGKRAVLVLVQQSDGQFRATAPQLPELVVEGPTAEEAVRQIRDTVIAERLGLEARGEEIPMSRVNAIYA